MRPWRSPGTVKDAGDVVGVVDNLEDAHAAAALAADGDVEREDPGEELHLWRPTARPPGSRPPGAVACAGGVHIRAAPGLLQAHCWTRNRMS